MSAAAGIKTLTIILCVNDLESDFIERLAAPRNVDLRRFDADWGGRPPIDDEKLDPKTMADHVAIIEMPYPALEEKLRHAGKRLTIIDHHIITQDDGTVVDRHNPRCSAAQLIQGMNWKLTDEEETEFRAVEANDTGSWFGLMRAFANRSVDEAMAAADEIRERENKIRAKFRNGDAAAKLSWADWECEPAPAGVTVTYSPPRKSYRAIALDPDLGASSHRKFHILSGPASHIEFAGESYARKLAIDAHRDRTVTERRAIEQPEVLRIGLKSGGSGNEGEDREAAGPEIESLFFAGGSAALPLMRDIAKQRRRNPDPRLRIYSGGSVHGGYLYALGDPGKLSEMADLILDNAVHGARPLRAWNASFIQALTVPGLRAAAGPRLLRKSGGDRNEFGLTALDLSARNYFLPALQGMIAPTEKEAALALANPPPGNPPVLPLLTYNIPLRGHVSVKVTGSCERKFAICEPVRELLVHFGFGDLVYIEWRFCGTFLSGADSQWRALLAASGTAWDGRVHNAARLADFIYAARQCFSAGKRGPGDKRKIRLIDDRGYDIANPGKNQPPFTKFGSGDVPNPTTPQGWFAGLLRLALHPFFPQAVDRLKIDLMLDERARFVAAMVPIGGPATLPAGVRRAEALRARFAGGDDFQDGHFYNEKFALGELNRGTYDRFAPETRFQATNHSFSATSHGWFGENVIVNHMRDHYGRMFLVAQSYVSTFQQLWREIVVQTRAQRGDAEKLALEAREKMVRFTNAFWFRSLSSQIQGEEIYRKMLAELPVDRERAELDEELENAEGLVQSRRAHDVNESILVLTILFGVATAIPAIWAYGKDWLHWAPAAGGESAVDTGFLLSWGGIGFIGILLLIRFLKWLRNG